MDRPSIISLRTVELPYSEVCMHMRVAGKEMDVALLSTGMCQLFDADGRPFSMPITRGEAGWQS